jgi:RND family efflux transporter MFP subunit
MNNRTIREHLSFILICFFVLVSLVSCTQTQTDKAVVVSKEEDQTKKAAVRVPIGAAQTQDLARDIVIQGIVGPLPDHSVKVSPAIAGKLAQVLVIDGQSVKRGQLIAKLDDRHIKEQLDQGTAAVQTAEANLQQAQSALTFAKDNLDRQNHLFQAEVAAKKDVLAAQNQVQSAELQIQSLQSQIKSAKASRAQIQTELSLTEIRSPIEGVVAKRFLNIGDTCDPNTPVAQIVGLQNVIVSASLPADSPQQLKVGEHARIRSDAEQGTAYDATITSISPIVDRTSNTITVQLLTKNPGGRLRDGQAVNVSITSKVDRSAVVIPQSALVPDPNDPERQMVYVVRDGKATRVPVVPGGSKGDLVEVVSGLRPGQAIVTEGGYGLPDGSAVENVDKAEAGLSLKQDKSGASEVSEDEGTAGADKK